VKRLAVVVLVFGAAVAGYVGYVRIVRPRRACANQARQCPIPPADAAAFAASCRLFFDELVKYDDAASARAATCMLEARSCETSQDCMAGGIRTISNAHGRADWQRVLENLR
jgi:hypothetical protein